MTVSENSNLDKWLTLGARSRSFEDGLELNLENVDWSRLSSSLPEVPVEVTAWKMKSGPDDRIRELLTLLQGQQQIKSLALQGVNVNEATIDAIIKIPELIEVDFSDTNFGNTHFEKLCQLERLQNINLAETSITDNGLIYLKKMRLLKQLNLNKNKITEAGLHYLEGLVSLRDLSLGGTPLTGAALKWLQRLVLLEKLDLRHTHITHNGLMALTYFRRLQKLKLGGNRIEDDGILILKQFVRLESLELAGTPITDQAIETLAQLPRIRRLYLAGTAISDVGLSQLAGVTSLLALDVRKTAVTAQGVEEFQQHLPQVQIKTDAEQKPASSVIRNIDLLEMNHIQLKSNQYGEPIALKTTEDTSPATHWFDVMTEMRSLKNIEVHDQHLDSDQFRKIRDLHQLQALAIKKCSLPETTLVSLCTLQNLGWLDLRDSAISDVGLKFISRIPSLSNLCLSRTQITDQGLIHLKNALLLKDLVVKQCAYVTDDGLDTLGSLEQLKHLDIRNTGISQSGFQTLCEKLPGCKIRY